jgi:hypothetical protein
MSSAHTQSGDYSTIISFWRMTSAKRAPSSITGWPTDIFPKIYAFKKRMLVDVWYCYHTKFMYTSNDGPFSYRNYFRTSQAVCWGNKKVTAKSSHITKTQQIAGRSTLTCVNVGDCRKEPSLKGSTSHEEFPKVNLKGN